MSFLELNLPIEYQLCDKKYKDVNKWSIVSFSYYQDVKIHRLQSYSSSNLSGLGSYNCDFLVWKVFALSF